MIDRGIEDDLSPEAFYLLIKLMKLAPNEDNSNNTLKKKTGFSKRRFDRAKKELVGKSLLETKQLYGNVYALYIGKKSVYTYKQKYKKSDSRYEQNELLKVKKEHLDSSKTRLSKSREYQIETI